MHDTRDLRLRGGRDLPAADDAQDGAPKAEYAHFFSLTLDLLCIVNLDGYFTDVNAAFERVLGYTEQELRARPLLDFVHPDDRAATAAELKKLASGLPTISFENRHRRKDGVYTWLTWTCNAPTPTGAIYAVARDISTHKRLEEQLHQQLSFTRAITTSLGEGVYAFDAAGHVTFMNPAAEQILGWTEAELLGRNIHEAIHFQRADGTPVAAEASPLPGVVASGVPLRIDEDVFTRKDGTIVPVSYTSSPVVIPGRVEGVVVAFHDITERKRTERALREQHAFISLLQVAAVAANESSTPDEALQRCLDHVCAQTGWQVGHVYLHNATTDALLPTTLWHLDEPERFAPYRAITEMTTFVAGDGLPGQVLATGTPAWIADIAALPESPRAQQGIDLGIRSGFAFPVLVETEVVAVLEFFSTEVSQLDEPLAEVMAHIGMQIGRVVERSRARHQLQAIATQLERSNRELQDFAAVASHDLQEPLRKIQAFGDRLQRQYRTELGPDGRDYLDRMQSAAGRMQQLINDLLAFSRVTTRGQPFVAVDLAQVAQEVMADLETRLEQSGGRVDIGTLPTIDADPLQMRQLLQNLIGNALKFYAPDAAPVVEVHATVLSDEGASPAEPCCQLVVQDNGIGFDDKYLDRIFAIFQRLHPRGAYEGTGVGLAICRKIVERHGGTITAHGTPGQGASFVVTLPMRQLNQDVGGELA